MYREFFQLDSFPFNNNPDPRFLCMLPQTKEALACLEYGIAARKGMIVLLGEVGTGKTTLLRSALNSMRNSAIRTSFIFNPRLDVLEFLEFMLADFGIIPASRTKSAMLLQLNRFLVDCFAAGDTCVLVVDEAQSLSPDLLEEIRLLTNLETDSEKLLQIVLSGQTELEVMLKEQGLRQLRQRISLWCRTQPLTLPQTVDYVVERLETAGSSEAIFLPDAIAAIYSFSKGIPRLINLICEHSLILSFVEGLKQIPAGIVFAVATDLQLEPSRSKDRPSSTGEFNSRQSRTSEPPQSMEKVS